MALTVFRWEASFSAAEILDIASDQDSLMIKAQIAVEDISDIKLGVA